MNTLDCGYQKVPLFLEANNEMLFFSYKTYQDYGGDYQIYVTEDNKKIVSISDEEIRTWELKTGELIQRFCIENQEVKISDLNRNIFVTTNRFEYDDCKIAIWNLEKFKDLQLTNYLDTDFTEIENIQLSLDKSFLVASGYICLHYNDPSEEDNKEEYWIDQFKIKIWDISKNKLLFTINELTYKLSNESRCFEDPIIKIAHDNQHLVTVDNFISDEDTYIFKIWDLQKGKLLSILPDFFKKEIIEVTRNNQLITCDKDNITLKIWDIKTGILLFNLQEHSETINSCTLNPNHDILVSNDIKGTINIWNLTTGKLLQKIIEPVPPIHEAFIYEVKFSHNGKIMLIRNKEKISIWELHNEEEELETKNLNLDKNKLVENLMLQGHNRYINQNYHGAVESYTKALDLASTNQAAYNKRSSAYSAIGEINKALEDLRKALQFD